MTTNTNAAPDNCTVLPDGSAFATASYPLPKNHWLYAPREYESGAEEPKELPHPILTHAHSAEVVAAVRYAIRGATMCGKEKDFDPDALVQNAVYALCGPYGKAALSTAAQPPAGIWVPTELAERVQETMGEFLMDHGWRQQDMDTSDEFGALLAVATKAYAAPAPAAQGDACDAKHIAALTEIVRMPNAEYVADAHNAAVKYLRARAAKEGGEA